MGTIQGEKIYKLGLFNFQKSALTFRDLLFRIMSTAALTKSSKVLVPSSIMHSVKLGWGVKDSKLATIYNSVNFSDFKPQQNRKEYDLITVSRLISIKKIEELIVLVGKLNLSLLIVGDGPIKAELELLANRCHAKVDFFGSATQTQLPDLYRIAAIFVLNSDFEARTPYSLLEARASGLVCIGKENTGCENVITNKTDGYLISKKSGLTLESAVNSAMALSAKEVHEFSLKAIADTRVRFSHESIFGNILKEIHKYEH